jgi:hypothetical protein
MPPGIEAKLYGQIPFRIPDFECRQFPCLPGENGRAGRGQPPLPKSVRRLGVKISSLAVPVCVY